MIRSRSCSPSCSSAVGTGRRAERHGHIDQRLHLSRTVAVRRHPRCRRASTTASVRPVRRCLASTIDLDDAAGTGCGTRPVPRLSRRADAVGGAGADLMRRTYPGQSNAYGYNYDYTRHSRPRRCSSATPSSSATPTTCTVRTRPAGLGTAWRLDAAQRLVLGAGLGYRSGRARHLELLVLGSRGDRSLRVADGRPALVRQRVAGRLSRRSPPAQSWY